MPAIFTLADQLRAMNGNDFYDIAQRLFTVWKQEQEKEITDTLRKIVFIYKKKLLLLKARSFHLFHSRASQIAPIYGRGMAPSSFHQSESYLSPQQHHLKHSSSLTGSPPMQFNPYEHVSLRPKTHFNFAPPPKPKNQQVFERLFNEASTKEELRELRQELKQHRELNQCTFHPQTNRSGVTNRSGLNRSSSCASSQAMTVRGPLGLNSPATVQRLSKDERKMKQGFYKKQKEERELRECTFAPKINSSTSRVDSSSAYSAHQRLYQHSEAKKVQMREIQILKSEQEIEGCSFTPSTSQTQRYYRQTAERENSSGKKRLRDQSAHQRLYKEKDRVQRKIERKKAELIQRQIQGCTFKPLITQKAQQLTGGGGGYEEDEEPGERSNQPIHQRLYKLQQEKKEKMQLKRRELEEEQHRIHNMLHQKSKIKGSPGRVFSQNLGDQLALDYISDQNQKEVSERLYALRNNQNKRRLLIEKVNEEEGCSFKPQTNPKSTTLMKSASCFLDRSQEFVRGKQQRLKAQKTADLPECTFQPNSRLGERVVLSGQNVSHKLYKDAEEHEVRLQELRAKMQYEHTFAPEINERSKMIMEEGPGSSGYGRSLAPVKQ